MAWLTMSIIEAKPTFRVINRTDSDPTPTPLLRQGFVYLPEEDAITVLIIGGACAIGAEKTVNSVLGRLLRADLNSASEDPADPQKTKRVMSVGLGQDW